MTDATTPEPRTAAGLHFDHLWGTKIDRLRHREWILAIEAQARPAVASDGLRYDRLQRALAIVLEDYYHERDHDYEHDAGQLAMLLLAQGLASDAGSVGALNDPILVATENARDRALDYGIAVTGQRDTAIRLLRQWATGHLDADSRGLVDLQADTDRWLASLDAERQGEQA